MGFMSAGSRAKGLLDMLLCNLAYPYMRVPPVDMHGKNVIVTGANVGIGLETARKLAEFGANVTLACRNLEKGENARQYILKTVGGASVEVRKVDFTTFASVKAFVADWGEKPIDVLINNAGITSNKYTHTDGYESTYFTNCLSHILFTILLLPRLTPSARIINVSSYAHFSGLRRDLDPEDLDNSKLLESKGFKEGDMFDSPASLELYNKSKLAQVVFTKALQEKLDASPKYGGKNIVVFAVHPGLVLSSIHERHVGSSSEAYETAMKKFMSLVNRFGISNEQGACTSVFLAVDPSVASYKWPYWDRMTARTPNPLVDDEDVRKQLWPAWLKACGLPEEL